MSDYIEVVPERFHARARSIGTNEIAWCGSDIVDVLDALRERGAVILGVESVIFPWAGSGPMVQVICDTSASVKVRQAASRTDKVWLSREKALADIERNERNPFGKDIWYLLVVDVTTPAKAAAQAFTAAATAYKQWMEATAGESKPTANVHELYGKLADLQAAMAELPPVKLSGEGTGNSDSAATEDAGLEDARAAWALAAAVASKLQLGAYSTVFDALDSNDSGSIMKNLDDDLGDIYRGVQDALALPKAVPVDDAIWQWRFAYYSHWGRHVVHAQAALFSYLASEGRFFMNQDHEGS